MFTDGCNAGEGGDTDAVSYLKSSFPKSLLTCFRFSISKAAGPFKVSISLSFTPPFIPLTITDVIIGSAQTEGVHCLGPCTIRNVWWEDVCEDALTIKQTSGTSYIIGGGARNAADKVIQHNGGGTVSVTDFFVSNFGKLYRSCGNCSTQYKRTFVATGVVAESGSSLAGINTNYGGEIS
jgi:hypothetical protein